MKNLIKTLIVSFSILFSFSTKAQSFQVGCKLSYYADFYRNDSSYVYQQEDSAGLLRTVFASRDDIKLIFLSNKYGTCSEILMAFKTKEVFDDYVNMFNTEWTDLGFGNWQYDRTDQKIMSKARLIIENGTVFIHINGYYYGNRDEKS